jgi:hypothetical protein
MKPSGSGRLLVLLAFVLSVRTGVGENTNSVPHFQEIFRLLRVNLPNITEDELNRAAVEGLVNHFHPRVFLSREESQTPANPKQVALGKSEVYDRDYGYIRVAHVLPGLGEEIRAAWKKLSASHDFKGLVLDLRFADGEDYEAAADAADLFQSKEQRLLTWGDHSASSKSKSDPLKVPLTVLVNRETAGGAEALAAVLRETGMALLIGSRTAGRVYVFKQFELSNGQRLGIASSPVRVGDDEKPIERVVPDVEVNVRPEDERAYFADAYKTLSRSPAPSAASSPSVSTNRAGRRRINEAELVRIQRDGQDLDELDAAAGTVNERSEPVMRDPALVRALDLLKGIAIVQRGR